MTLYARFAAHLDAVLDALEAEGALAPGIDRGAVAVEPPRDPAHGDLATNAAMVLAKRAGTNPRALAEAIVPKLAALDEVAGAEVAGPGFINIRLDRSVWEEELRAILAEGDGLWPLGHGRGPDGQRRICLGQPDRADAHGPLPGRRGRRRARRLLEYAGHKVIREYYVNDAGAQVDVLARSAHLRYLEALGRQIGEIPEGLYPGDYLKPVGEALAAEFGDAYADAPEGEWLESSAAGRSRRCSS